jgi:hypothetical protein
MATRKYNSNIKWVFLFENDDTRDFFVDYLWEAIESDNGFMHDLLVWTPGTKYGFANAITKLGSSKNSKNVLLYRDEAYRPRVAKKFNAESGVESGGMSDYVRKLLDTGRFDDAVSNFEGSRLYTKDGDYPATIKSGLIGTQVPGRKVVRDLIIKCIGMFVGPRMPGDEREQSAFYVGQDVDDGELSDDSAIAAALELLKSKGYTVTKPVQERRFKGR